MTEEQAHGYRNLRHHEALGYWPALHARMGARTTRIRTSAAA